MKFFWNKKSKPEKRSNNVNFINPNSLTDSISFWMDNLQYGSLNLSVVYRCCEIISDGCAMLPIYITRNGKDVKNNLSLLFENHYHLIKCAILQVLLKGNGFIYIERSSDGKPINLRFLENKDVQIVYNQRTNTRSYTCTKISNRAIPESDMIHFMKHSIDGIKGISVLAYAAKTINLATDTETAAAGYFGNGGNLTGILCAKDYSTMEERQQAKDAFVKNLKSGDISVLPSEFSYQSVQMSSADAQLIESRLFNAVDIARFFGVSPILLGDLSKGGVNSIEQLQTQFLVQTLLPYIKMIEDELNKKLAYANIKINVDENYVIRTDKRSEAEYYTKLVSAGLITVNEAREAMGWEEMEGADKLIIAYTDIDQNQINTNNTNENGKEEEGNTEEGRDE